MKVFILAKHTGSYSDYTMDNVGVFATQALAEERQARLLDVNTTGIAWRTSTEEFREPFNPRADFAALAKRMEERLLADPNVAAAWSLHLDACARACVQPPNSVNDYWHDADPSFTIEEHDLIGGAV